MPGEGNINWTSVFRAIRHVQHIGAAPRLILEIKPEEIGPGAEWLAGRGLAK